ncbi:MAG: glycoside hydrolase family 32 protein [Selenomonadaceae bacterium]|nr:glycoside hydrolase family 32 protein [Selenomonadaceae bacterium]
MAKKSGEKLEEIKLRFNKQEVDARAREAVLKGGRWHNAFHIDAPYSLISDPNGLCCCNGTYHIFCQWNPTPINQNWHKNKSWMHTATKDFINYTMPELSLWPRDIHDKDGCHSGCGFVEDGKVRVFYTANSRDEDYRRTVAQRCGTMQEDGSITLDEIQVAGNPEGYTAHFRDPNFFYRNGVRYFAMAAQRMSDYPAKSSRPTNGAVLIYREKAEGGWELLGEVKTDYYDFGYMWECPNLMQFEDMDVLIVCPQGVHHEELKYQNHCLAGYFIGHFSVDSLDMIHGKFHELDKGFDFYSPQVIANEARHIMIAWIGMPDLTDTVESAADGWLYSLTMPRELTIHQGKVRSQPVEEMKALRQERTDVDVSNAQNIPIQLPKGSESDLNITFGAARQVEVDVKWGAEKFVIKYDRSTQIITLDREGMKLGGKGIRPFSDGKNTDVNIGTRKFKLFTNQDLNFRLFVDNSVIELFLQDGEEACSLLIYPEEDVAPVLEISSDKPIQRISGEVWKLGKFNYK